MLAYNVTSEIDQIGFFGGVELHASMAFDYNDTAAANCAHEI